MLQEVKTAKIKGFQKTVLDRYYANGRSLPRRETDNPYHILVSEIMLQQTQVSRVVPKYHHFLETLPTRTTLAHAPKKQLLTLRSGLGYNNRALRLQRTAHIIHTQHDDIIPDDEKTLLSLPGIGPYTAHALLAFVYNREVPVLDINIKRVLIHSFHLPKDTSDSHLRDLAFACIPAGHSKDRHNALMDYGALVLTSKITGIKSQPQSKFVGSTRRVRGSLLKHLLHIGPLSIDQAKSLFPHSQFDQILQGLIHEGTIISQNNTLTIK